MSELKKNWNKYILELDLSCIFEVIPYRRLPLEILLKYFHLNWSLTAWLLGGEGPLILLVSHI